MLSEINNDSLASTVKSNPEFEALLQSIIDDNKKTTSMFVHELRNPLSLLKGTIQYIEQKHPEAAGYKYWDQLQALLGDMEQIMADASLLNTCNYIHKDKTDLLSLIKNVISSFMPQALTQMIDLSISIEPGCEDYFKSYLCDSIKIKQAFSNLIKNALEAVKPGNFIHINLSHLPKDGSLPAKLSFVISNNGPQIPEDAVKNIFIPFITYKKGGTGIGLALVKKVIDLHYGSICVSSDENLTSFTVLLPL